MKYILKVFRNSAVDLFQFFPLSKLIHVMKKKMKELHGKIYQV